MLKLTVQTLGGYCCPEGAASLQQTSQDPPDQSLWCGEVVQWM